MAEGDNIQNNRINQQAHVYFYCAFMLGSIGLMWIDFLSGFTLMPLADSSLGFSVPLLISFIILSPNSMKGFYILVPFIAEV